MLVERGRVTKALEGQAEVSILRPSSCASCSARGACMTLGPNERRLEVDDPVGAQVGDEVEIGLPPGRVVWASTIAYLVPVAAMLLGGLIGYGSIGFVSADSGAAIGAFGGLIAAGVGIWIHGRVARRREGAMPKVLRVVAPAAAPRGAVDSAPSVG